MNAFVISTLLLAACATEPALASTEQHSTGTFAGMVRKTLGIPTGWSLLNYGCYCGLGNPDNVPWIDEIDNCCRLHDEKWLAAPQQEAGCDCGKAVYKYEVKDGKVVCGADQGTCKDYCCAADQAFVACVAKEGPLNPQNETIDRADRCEPLECRADLDCDGGMYCDRGTCRMYCDPGSLAACDVTHAPAL